MLWGRVEVVIASVIKEITKGHITRANLASRILESLRRNLRVLRLGHRSAEYDSRHHGTDVSQVSTALLKAISEREREALKWYYVDLEAENDICAKLDLTDAQFRNFKRRFRTQFMNARHPERLGSV
jgi:hypothetical protein